MAGNSKGETKSAGKMLRQCTLGVQNVSLDNRRDPSDQTECSSSVSISPKTIETQSTSSSGVGSSDNSAIGLNDEHTLFYAIPPISGDFTGVRISILKIHANDLFETQIVESEHCRRYEKFIQRMESFYKMARRGLNIPEDCVKLGMIVILEAVEDNGYHVFRRAQVTRTLGRRKDQLMWEVTCFDEAEVVVTSHDGLHYIKPSLMELPRQSFQCVIDGLEYVSGTGVLSHGFQKFRRLPSLRKRSMLGNITRKGDTVVLQIVHSIPKSRISGIEFEQYLYENMTPEVTGNCRGRCVGADENGLMAFQLSCPQTDLVTRLNPKFAHLLSELVPENLGSMIDDGFVKHTYINVTMRSPDSVCFERFVVEDFLYRQNQVLVNLLDAPTQLSMDIGSGNLYRADRIHKNLARWPPQFVSGKIAGLPSALKPQEVYRYLKDKKLRISEKRGSRLELRVTVEATLAPGSGSDEYLGVQEWATRISANG